jgi:hypothetical protein
MLAMAEQHARNMMAINAVTEKTHTSFPIKIAPTINTGDNLTPVPTIDDYNVLGPRERAIPANARIIGHNIQRFTFWKLSKTVLVLLMAYLFFLTASFVLKSDVKSIPVSFSWSLAANQSSDLVNPTAPFMYPQSSNHKDDTDMNIEHNDNSVITVEVPAITNFSAEQTSEPEVTLVEGSSGIQVAVKSYEDLQEEADYEEPEDRSEAIKSALTQVAVLGVIFMVAYYFCS